MASSPPPNKMLSPPSSFGALQESIEQPLQLPPQPKNTKLTPGLLVGGLLLIMVFLCVVCIWRRRMKKRRSHIRYEKYNSLLSSSFPDPRKRTFTYEELSVATKGFSEVNKLGHGGFGEVHKGVLPDKETTIAVKSLIKGKEKQGESQFRREVEIISVLHHRHLVSLLGFCSTPGKRILVYPFIPNRTLEYHLHGNKDATLDWSQRQKIAIGSAKGIVYLHEECNPPIIHRDIKSSNILLDENFEAMVADFGLAKMMEDNFSKVATGVMGTYGYIAPEYQETVKVSQKADSFSFGVVLLELITGKRPVNLQDYEDVLVDWARPLLTKSLEDQIYSVIVDSRFGDNYDPTQMRAMIGCADACISTTPRTRPRMSQVLRVLEGYAPLEELNTA